MESVITETSAPMSKSMNRFKKQQPWWYSFSKCSMCLEKHIMDYLEATNVN